MSLQRGPWMHDFSDWIWASWLQHTLSSLGQPFSVLKTEKCTDKVCRLNDSLYPALFCAVVLTEVLVFFQSGLSTKKCIVYFGYSLQYLLKCINNCIYPDLRLCYLAYRVLDYTLTFFSIIVNHSVIRQMPKDFSKQSLLLYYQMI